jgi:hypothetical protein
MREIVVEGPDPREILVTFALILRPEWTRQEAEKATVKFLAERIRRLER